MEATIRRSIQQKRRIARVRGKVEGTAERPRMAIHRANQHTYLQLIDDVAAKTIVGQFDKGLSGNKTARAIEAATLLAKKAQEKGIKSIVFDRRYYRYHGRVKAVADALRAAGMEF